MRGASVQPPAIAAIQALDATARIVLVEEDPGLISRLCEDLDGIDAIERIRVTADPASIEPGEIALVEAPFARVATSLASGIGDDPALVRLAPLAARALPWAAVEPIVDLAATDVLLRVPLEDFAKQARFTGPLADLPPHIRRVVEGCSALLSDPRHGWIAAWREAQRTGGMEAAMAAIIDRMQALLGGVDEERMAHALAVEGAGGPVHLLLSHPVRRARAGAGSRPARALSREAEARRGTQSKGAGRSRHRRNAGRRGRACRTAGRPRGARFCSADWRSGRAACTAGGAGSRNADRARSAGRGSGPLCGRAGCRAGDTGSAHFDAPAPEDARAGRRRGAGPVRRAGELRVAPG